MTHGSPQQTQRCRDAAALLLISTQAGKWVSAVSLAETFGLPWRPLAFALRRLSQIGVIVEREVTYVGSARSREIRREYQLIDERMLSPHPLFPRPMMPKRRTARLIRGRAGVWTERWSRKDTLADEEARE